MPSRNPLPGSPARSRTDYWRNRERLTVELKGPQDFVSHADRDVEALLRREIAAAFPDDAFLGEETAASFTGPLDRCWIVDPIDGTHNFLRGVPYWNVAIAYVEQGRAQDRRRVRSGARRALPRRARRRRVVRHRGGQQARCMSPIRPRCRARSWRSVTTIARRMRITWKSGAA